LKALKKGFAAAHNLFCLNGDDAWVSMESMDSSYFWKGKNLSFAVREPLPAGDAKRLLHLPHGAIMSD